MGKIEVRQLKYQLTPAAGWAWVGDHCKTFGPVLTRLDTTLRVRTGVANSDIIRSYVGLLVLGKSDFDAIENYRGDKFYKQALGIELLPSSPTLRQRMHAQASALSEHVPQMIQTLLKSHRPDCGVLPCGRLAVDIDTYAMDNGGTAKARRGPHLCRCGRLLPAGVAHWSARLAAAAVAASGHAALGQVHRGQAALRDPDGAVAACSGAEGAAACAAGLGLRRGHADGVRGVAEPAWTGAGGLPHQVEAAQHGPGRDGRAA